MGMADRSCLLQGMEWVHNFGVKGCSGRERGRVDRENSLGGYKQSWAWLGYRVHFLQHCNLKKRRKVNY